MRAVAVLVVLLLSGCTTATTDLGRLSACATPVPEDANATSDPNVTVAASSCGPDDASTPPSETPATVTITSSPTPEVVEGSAGSGNASDAVVTTPAVDAPTPAPLANDTPSATPTPAPTNESVARPTDDGATSPANESATSPANATAPLTSSPASLDVLAFTVDQTQVRNGGRHTLTFRAVLAAPASGARVALDVGALHAETATGALDALPPDEPSTFDGNGAKAWRGPGNGTAAVALRVLVPRGFVVGDASAVLQASDDAGRSGSSAPIAIVVLPYRELQIDSRPVGADGRASSLGWGGWRGSAGAVRVNGLNFLRIVNVGEDPNATVTIRLPAEGFLGQSDPTWSIPVAANVEFAPLEKTDANARPTLADLRWTPAADDGSVTLSFHGARHVLFVAYRILQMPAILPAQDYAATFSVAEGPA